MIRSALMRTAPEEAPAEKTAPLEAAAERIAPPQATSVRTAPPEAAAQKTTPKMHLAFGATTLRPGCAKLAGVND